MTVLSYPFALLPGIIVFGALATIAVPLFAFVWLVVFLVVSLVAVVTLGWGLVAALRVVGGRLWWRRQVSVKPWERGSDRQAGQAS